MKPILCLLGFHDWNTVNFNPGFSMRECKRCDRLENKPVGWKNYSDVSDSSMSLSEWTQDYAKSGITVHKGDDMK